MDNEFEWDVVQSLIAEAKIIAEVHPSKDARFFANKGGCKW